MLFIFTKVEITKSLLTILVPHFAALKIDLYKGMGEEWFTLSLCSLWGQREREGVKVSKRD